MLGSSWDVSWHFRWLRDDLAPPHLLNSAGTAVVIGLVVFHSYSGYGVDQRALRLMQWGIGMFLVAIPIDILNHRINGLDITSWSPSHGLLYLGTAIMLAGAIRGWWLLRRARGGSGTWSRWACGCSSSRTCSSPTSTRSTASCRCATTCAGHTTAEPQLLDFAAAQGQTPTMFMLPVPSWVHPPWLVCAGLLALVVARKVVGLRWTATTIAGAYLAYRAVMWLLLVGLGFPPSVLPFVLLVGAVLVDLAVTAPGARAGWPGRSSPASSTPSPSARRPSACCRRGTGGRCCRSPSCFGLLWTAVDLLDRSRLAGPVEGSRRARRAPRARAGLIGGARRGRTGARRPMT